MINLFDHEFEHFGSPAYDPEKFDSKIEVRGYGWNKPKNCGLWLSPVKQPGDNIVTWSDWCFKEQFDVHNNESPSFKIRIKKDSKILSIQSFKDLIKQKSIIYIDKNVYLNGDLIGCKNDNVLFESLDDKYKKNWDYIIHNFDGMYVAAGSNDILYNQFYGWDCDSICIFNKDIILT